MDVTQIPEHIFTRVFKYACVLFLWTNPWIVYIQIQIWRRNETDLLYPSPAPHFRPFQVFLIYILKCPSFSTSQRCAPNVALH